jgi:hypothetical protein
MSTHPPYDDVPDVEPGSEPDPHWLELRGPSSGLPEAYLPPAMAGEHAAWVRIAAVTVIAVFLFATVTGVCLTYGPKLWQ